MRIVYVLTSLGVGGAEKQVIGLAERMAARGHCVLLLVLKARSREEWPTDVETIYLNLTKNPVQILRGLLAARGVLKDFKPDLVHSHTFPANLFARILKFISAPFLLIGTIHNVYEGGWWRMLAYRLTDGLSERMTAVSEAAGEGFIRLKVVVRSKLLVITNGIEVEEFSPEKFGKRVIHEELGESEHFVWMAAGRVAAAKDYENLLRAFALVLEKQRESRLWIAGEESAKEGERLRRLAAELAVGQAVQWLGLRRDLVELMANADGFVLSSAWEGMPLVVGEAMAMEKPVVATDVGGVREILGSCGVIVPAKNASALARGMLDVQLMGSDERRQMGAMGRERVVRDFSMERRVVNWEMLYENDLKAYGDAAARISPVRFAMPVLVGALLRLAFLVVVLFQTGTSVIASGDTSSYLLPGMNLLLHGRFFNAMGPEIDRTPGYPFYLALVSAWGFVFAAAVQVVVSVLSILIVIRIARSAYCKSQDRNLIALIAAWIFAVEPLSVIFSVRLLPETLFVFFLLLAMERLVVFMESERLEALGCCAFLLVVETYVRPIGYYLAALIAIGLAVVLMRRAKLRWQAPLALIAIALPLLGIWQMRNQVVAGFAGFSSVAQKNLYFYQAAGVLAEVEHRSLEDMQAREGYGDEAAYVKAHPEQVAWSQGARADFQRSEAMKVLREHPMAALGLQAKGAAVVAFTPAAADLLRMLGGYPEDAPTRVVAKSLVEQVAELARKHIGVALVMMILECVLIGLYGFASFTILRLPIRSSVKVLFIGLIFYFVVVSGGMQAVGRYRLPVMPFICILAAGGVHAAGNKLTAKRSE